MATMSQDPNSFAQAWVNGVSGSAQKATNGVNAVTKAPSQSAIAAQTKMITNWTAAVNNGTWAKALGAVSLSDWQTAMVQKGIPRMAQGAQAAQSKMQAFAAKLLPAEAALQAKVVGMPNTTKVDTKARMNAWFDGMTALKGKLK